ncbi:hypothetical protein [Alicycliphilus denitrificans]|uniref:hypothetical protein n=1 Tax=Alicycliphilus denitrificans TaxID=179636 RepID=UPI00384F5AF6
MYCLHHDGQSYAEVSCDTPDALIVVTRLELAQMSPFNLDPQSAVEIGGALLMVMAVAWLLRQARKYLESE